MVNIVMKYLWRQMVKSVRDNWLIWMSFSIASFIVILFRYPFLHAPYSFDQSMYLYTGKALSLGAIPYKDVFEQRMFGVGYIFAFLYKIGFSTVVQFRIFEILWIIATLAIFSFATKKIIENNLAVAIGTVYFSLLLVNYTFMGGSDEGLTEISLILPVLILILSTFLFGKKQNSIRLFIIGLSLLAGFMISTRSIDLLIPVVIYLFFLAKKQYGQKWLKYFFHSTAIVLSTLFVPIIIYIAYLGHYGALGDFYNALIKFNQYYGSTIPYSYGANAGLYAKTLYSIVNLLQYIPRFPISYIIVILGIILLIKKRSNFNLFVLLLFFFSVLNIASGLKPWPHYFIMVYPFIALMSCLVVLDLDDSLRPFLAKHNYLSFPILAITILFFVYPYQLKPFIASIQQLQTDKIALSNSLKQSSPDPIVAYTKQHYWNGDYAIFWTNFGEYLETNMRSSTRYFGCHLLNMWGLPNGAVIPAIVNQVLDDVKAKPPKIIVLNTTDFAPTSLIWDTNSPLRIYIDSHYKIETSLSSGTVEVYVQK